MDYALYTLAVAVLIVGALGSSVTLIINYFLAGSNVKPDVPWSDRLVFRYIVFRQDVFTGKGRKAAARARWGLLIFGACLTLLLAIAKLTGGLR